MSELINRIPGVESVMGKLRGVVDTTAQLKARQRITGRSGQLGYAIDSENPWDYTGSVAFTNATYNTARFHIVFTGDGTQKFPIVVPQFDVRLNGTGTGNRMHFDPAMAEYIYVDGAIDVTAYEYGKPFEGYFASETQSGWLLELFHIGVTGSGNFDINIKPRAQASCPGTFTVTRVA